MYEVMYKVGVNLGVNPRRTGRRFRRQNDRIQWAKFQPFGALRVVTAPVNVMSNLVGSKCSIHVCVICRAAVSQQKRVLFENSTSGFRRNSGSFNF
jgi:hypothetical protein